MSLARSRWITREHSLWVLRQAGIVVLAVFLYFRVRALTEGARDVAVAHARAVVDVEKSLGIYVEHQLQEPFVHTGFPEAFANWVYIWGHWPVIIATMVWTAWRHSEVFLRLRDAMLVSGFLGMVVFATYPVAPPRLAGLGLVDTVTAESHAYRVLQPPGLVDQYAAMPSLHVGWDLLVGIAIVTAASNLPLKVVGCALPLLMAAAVVVTANHYILDVVAGVALVLVGHAVALRLERRRRARAVP